ncbi:MAG: zinc dependent phospholipase C family protein, partial [Coriobacteriales bacterium]|nr:zinc dependent phospholipase C family protein [Coriobacteriales bacterium]
MPALLTHDCFGRDVLDRDGGVLGGDAGSAAEPAAEFAAELRHAFLLGNQGPDPFFFALRTLRLGTIKRFGSLMHRERVDETVEAFCRLACAQPGPAGSLLHAYLLGFVCHFMLDSVMHPFVYAQQYAICDAGVKGLDRRDGSVVHGQIEADLDAMLVRQRRGEGIRTYRY